ncbi:hypothetical protein MMYC01_201019 [Madurella mycetomatis]|uniref:Extracellular membrane protein CFEM domain-containing protein n=1 Tax=Madurella mycetomatis TaxID=100816 RepID=A0A175WF34_9PEZI|nr:hypothetical protein MMYC01_201019 [Madurella mycetomatis]
MVFTSHIRLALIGVTLALSFIGQVQSTNDFQFSPCVENCISSSGCRPTSARCMCRAARHLLLDSVISCLFFNCKSDLRDFDDLFLEPIEEGCEDRGRDIPRSKLRAAESLASSYIANIPRLTTTAAAERTTTTARAITTPKPTTSPTTARATPSSTSAVEQDDDDDDVELTSTTDRPAPTTNTASPPPPPLATAQSSSSAGPSPPPETPRFGDTNPFAVPGSAGSRTWAFSPLLGFTLIAAMIVWR